MIPPFRPKSRDPKELADLIDRIVEDKEFREKLASEENEFIKEVADPYKAGTLWDKIFEKVHLKCGSINKNSSNLSIKFRSFKFKIANRLYFSKFKKLVKRLMR